MSYTVTRESLDNLAAYYTDSSNQLRWSFPFVLPVWLKVWWHVFGADYEQYLSVVREGEKIIGIAPLKVKEGKASFIGSIDLCDYLDFVIVPGREKDFFNVLLDDLKSKGIAQLDLESLRPESTVLTGLAGIATGQGHEVLTQAVDVTVEMGLPPTWEEYLEKVLDTKQRHEVKRKLRNLMMEGKVEYHAIKDIAAVNRSMDMFLKLFVESREDKATFMTKERELFFRSLAENLAKEGLLRLGALELDGLTMAMIMYFDYNHGTYLYNSGFDLRYEYLSAGLLSKVMSIQESINEGKQNYDFLKGNEVYKYHLGGQEVSLYRCQINLKA